MERAPTSAAVRAAQATAPAHDHLCRSRAARNHRTSRRRSSHSVSGVLGAAFEFLRAKVSGMRARDQDQEQGRGLGPGTGLGTGAGTGTSTRDQDRHKGAGPGTGARAEGMELEWKYY